MIELARMRREIAARELERVDQFLRVAEALLVWRYGR